MAVCLNLSVLHKYTFVYLRSEVFTSPLQKTSAGSDSILTHSL